MSPPRPETYWNATFCANTTPVIQAAWRRWQHRVDAWLDTRERSDSAAERRMRAQADMAALRLAAIPSQSVDDTAPKTFVAAFYRCHGDDTHLLTMIEAAISLDLATGQSDDIG